MNQQGKYNTYVGSGRNVHQAHGAEVESRVGTAPSGSSQAPIAKDSTEIIQNVTQHREVNLNFERASNFRIGDGY
ncbi:hypothetical protein [Coleofasciculus sp. FACHB-129]|uniref:hypothetical protein n=1 Tax=Cyanophyceae TaxID=3028117 RepID=UPI0016885301|nr:hypothetical protein [Coleofasciculus sp. FACHB-129]MBD1895517.1 hypothetical protein [Coleofasciculus sp. FACHB-129]